MHRLQIGALALAILLPASLPAQNPQPAPKPTAFEAADIHPSPFSYGANYFHQAPFTRDRFQVQAGTRKLKKAGPANRASCTDRVAPGERDPRAANPMVTQYMHCNNVTIDQFARELQGYSGYIIKTPVLNASGIQGRYDLTLSFTGLQQLEMLGLAQGGATPAPGAARSGAEGGPGASDPAGVVLLQDAVAKQLGLKLVLEKRPIPALEVDSMQEQPTEN
jgi:uncharacterized protein (TIGR03435 family)